MTTGAVTGAILAGGLSRRMGFNKAHIKLGDETILERNIDIFSNIFDRVMVVTSLEAVYEKLSTEIITDIHLGAGSLGGIYTALYHAEGAVFVAACDMPGLDAGAIRGVIEVSKEAEEFDAFIPFIHGRYHPMHALYRKSCLKPLLKMIEDKNLKVTELIEKIRVRSLTIKDLPGTGIAASVANVNTPEELDDIEGAEVPGD